MGKSRKNTDFGFMVTREMAGEWVENIKKTDPEGWQHMFSNVRTRITGGTQKKAPSSILRTGSVRTEKRRKKKQTINSPR